MRISKSYLSHAIKSVAGTSALALAVLPGLSLAALEEIVITAQKRVENLQDVPISVSAVTGDSMIENNITDMTTLSQSLPSVTITRGVAEDSLSIRGVGSGGGPGFQQSVGTFIDGIYMGRSSQSRAKFLDLERFEVLRGPQGTYFGNNTIAGALNIITKKPGNEFDGYVNVYYEPDDEELTLDLAGGGSLTENFGARLAIKHTELGGYLSNAITGKDVGSDSFTGRVTLDWAASDNLGITLKVEG